MRTAGWPELAEAEKVGATRRLPRMVALGCGSLAAPDEGAGGS